MNSILQAFHLTLWTEKKIPILITSMGRDIEKDNSMRHIV